LIKALTGKQVFCVFLHEMVWYTGLTNNEKKLFNWCSFI